MIGKRGGKRRESSRSSRAESPLPGHHLKTFCSRLQGLAASQEPPMAADPTFNREPLGTLRIETISFLETNWMTIQFSLCHTCPEPFWILLPVVGVQMEGVMLASKSSVEAKLHSEPPSGTWVEVRVS